MEIVYLGLDTDNVEADERKEEDEHYASLHGAAGSPKVLVWRKRSHIITLKMVRSDPW